MTLKIAGKSSVGRETFLLLFICEIGYIFFLLSTIVTMLAVSSYDTRAADNR